MLRAGNKNIAIIWLTKIFQQAFILKQVDNFYVGRTLEI